MIAECRRFTLVFCLLCTAMAPSAFAKAAPTTTSSLSGRDAASSLRAMPERLSKLYVQANLNIEGVTISRAAFKRLTPSSRNSNLPN